MAHSCGCCAWCLGNMVAVASAEPAQVLGHPLLYKSPCSTSLHFHFVMWAICSPGGPGSFPRAPVPGVPYNHVHVEIWGG